MKVAATLVCAITVVLGKNIELIGKPCNCNPAEAPEICAGDGSDGTLIARENCNQFYNCFNGKPVTFTCPETLLYNPYRELCDWPENVICGDRIIPGHKDEDINGGNEDNPGNDNPAEAPEICAREGADGILVAHEKCNKFYKCFNGNPVALSCPAALLYNPRNEQCDWPENVDCRDRIIPEPEDNDDDNGEGGGGDDDNGGGGNGDSGGGGDDDNDGGGDGDNGGGDDDDNVGGGDNDNGGGGDGDNGGGGNDDNGDIDGGGSGNDDPAQAPEICARAGSDGILVAHEHCNAFYKCYNGKPVALRCPGELLYNPRIEQCDWPANVYCGDRIIPAPEDNDDDNGGGGGEDDDNGGGGNDDNGGNGGDDNGGGGDGDNGGDEDDDNGDIDGGGSVNDDPAQAPEICARKGSDSILVAHEHCNEFYKCFNGKPVALRCPGELLYNPRTEQCDWPANVNCGDRIIPAPEDNDDNDDGEGGGGDGGGGDGGGGDDDNGGGGGDDNGGGGGGGGDGDNGGGGDDDNEGGGDDDNGDIDGGGSVNDDPAQASEICARAGSDGILVAHEHCNAFYKCYQGKPVALRCPGELLYNPRKEQCDWPANVDCGDRIIPAPEDNDDDNGEGGGGDDDNGGGGGDDSGGGGGDDNGGGGDDDNGGGGGDDNGGGGDDDNGDGGNDDNGGGGDDDNDGGGDDDNGGGGGGGDGDNGGGGGGDDDGGSVNDDPAQASKICARDGSDGVLVAHENCDKFFICNFGLPVTVRCVNGLFFNPNNKQCDWPKNVNCGDRIIPESNRDYNLIEKLGIVEDKESCNCDPSQAPEICSRAGSNGVLVAHEHCNQFYKCFAGNAVAMRCNLNLLYNPYKQWCDWPENVDCGDRTIPDVDTDGIGDDDKGESTCNCDPAEAPEICARVGSEGELVAHEACNKFYKCSHSIPVALECQSGLLYNPHREYCDWPSNVECGDRVN